MNGRVSHKNRMAICVFLLFSAGFVWNCGIVRGEAQVSYPADGAVIDGSPLGDVVYTRLDFIPGASAVKHTGYFSDNYDDVANRIEDANLGPPPFPEEPGYEYRYYVGLPPGQIPGDPYTESLVRGTTYYWTVDETDIEGKIYAGEIWEFTIRDLKVSFPNPPNEATFVETDVLLSWLPGFEIYEHDVYMGTDRTAVENASYNIFNQPPEFLATVFEPNILVTGLSQGVKYYWRIDEVWGRCPPPCDPPTYYIGDVWCFTTKPSPIYVDVDAGGANNGASWENAYNFLQDALIEAESALKPVEIRVAEGIYKPDRSTSDPNGSGDRTATFKLINGVTLKGGYAGFGEPDPNARDIEFYETILSGDLAGNDVDVNDAANLLDEPTRAENSYHVVTGSGTDSSAMLDGFTITAGNAHASSDYYDRDNNGGGMFNESGGPTISNCVFIGNSATSNGGGIYNNDYSNPTLANCTFTGNSAGYSGGGMASNSSSSPALTNCTFQGNGASSAGGMYNYYKSNPTLTNCIFIGNSATFGGGMYNNESSSPTLVNCLFSGNSASQKGGGMVNYYKSNPTLTKCTLSGNSALRGGGIWNHQSSPSVTNCTFSGNSANSHGGGVYNWGSSSPTLTNCTYVANSAPEGNALAFDSYQQQYPSSVEITNCILSDGGKEVWNNDNSVITITYSDVEGGWPGLGNIDADPCFVDAGGGDFRISPDSPCIDAGDNSEPNLPATDLGGHPRIIDGDCNDIEVVDMGAYEFNYAYMGDFDYSCGVDFGDFSIIALAWMAEPGDHNWDPICNIGVPVDSLIDWRDVAILCDNWLEDNNPGRYCVVEDEVRYCIRTDKSVYHLGETVGIFYRITNLGSVPVSLGWAPIPPFCYHFVIVDNNGEHVWLWSWVMPTSPPVEFILDAYESKEYEIGWEMINDNGTYGTEDDFPIGAGVYKITSELLAGSEEDRVRVSVSVNVRE